MQDDEVILAANIDDCDKCPLYKDVCPGGWTSNGNGTPVEPPCCGWEDDTEVYVGMYPEYEPSAWELERAEQAYKEREEAREREKHRQDVEDARQEVQRLSKYGNIKTRRSQMGELCADWYCPECRRWVHPWHEQSVNCVTSTSCPRCGLNMAHSWLIDEDEEQHDFKNYCGGI